MAATQSVSQVRSLAPDSGALLVQGFRAHAPFLWIASAYVAAYTLILIFRPQLAPNDLLLGALQFVGVSLLPVGFCILLLLFYNVARHERAERPFPALAEALRSFFTDRRRLANGLPMLLVFFVFGYIFTQLKSNIAALNGFKLDAALAAADRLLHFGSDPWQLLQPALGYPVVTFALNVVYNLWFFVMWTVWVHFAFSTHASQARTRFLLTFLLLWIIGGSVMAIGYSSAGPCFYGRLGLPSDLFAPLMSYLREANQFYPIWAVDFQDALWQAHLEAGWSEISAMPSLHNGSALLFTLAAYQVSRAWGRVLAVNTLLIFLGSVHLAWHYAIDAYAAWALCAILWWVMGPVTQWWHARSAQMSFTRLMATVR
jgi:PAP2 superfamily